MRFAPVFRLFFVFIVSSMISTSAFAFDAKEYVEKIQQTVAKLGITISYGSLDALGDAGFILNDVVVEGVFQRNGKISPTKFKQIRVEGIEDMPGDSFAAKLVEFDDILVDSTTEDGEPLQIKISDGKGENIYFADPANPTAPLIHYPTTTYQMGEMTISVKGTEFLKLSSFHTNTKLNPDSKIFSAKLGIDKIDINLDVNDDPEFVARRKALGYDRFLVGVDLTANWDMNTGKLEVSNYSLDVEEAGRLQFTGVISGYTEELALRFRTMNAEIQTTEDVNEKKGKVFAMMAMMSQIMLDKASLTFKDASLTDRVLTLQAAKMGMPKADLVQLVPTMIPTIAVMLQKPEFIGMLAGNVAKFLNKPGDISIQLNPPNPVPITSIMLLGASKPGKMIDLLNVGVSANECTATC